MAISTNPDDPNFGLETDDTSPNFGLPAQQEGGVISGIAAGIGRMLNPVNLVRGALDIQPRSGLQEVLRTGRMLRDIVGGASVGETLQKEAPEVAQQQEALLGKYGVREQAAEWTGLAGQAALLAAPALFKAARPTLREVAFGERPVEAQPQIPETPITEAVTIETQQPIGGEINAEQISKPTQVHGDVLNAPRPEEGTGALPAPVSGEGVPTRGQGETLQQTPQEVAPAVPQPEQPHPLQDQTYYRGTNPNRVSGEDTFYSAHKPTAEEYSSGGPGGVEGKVEEIKGQSLPKNLYQATNKEELAAKLGISQDIYGTEFDNAVKSKLQSQGFEGVRYEEGTTLGDLTSGGQEEIHVFSKKPLPKTEAAPVPEEVAPETEPLPPAATAPEGGVSAAALEERPINAPEPGEHIGWQETRDFGNQWLDKGGNINKVMADFNRTGKLDPWEVGKGAAYLERLQANTNRMADALRENPNDPSLQQQYGVALAQEQRFANDFKPMATSASNQLKGFQGKVPLTDDMADSFNGLIRKYGEIQGKEVTPEAAVKADRLAKLNAKAKTEVQTANDELYRKIDTEYGRIRTPRKAPPTLEDLGKTFSQKLKEVCEV